jgi:DNA-binding transcriptional ArsR family regulator
MGKTYQRLLLMAMKLCHTRVVSQDLGVRLLDRAGLASAAEQAQLLAPQMKALSDSNRLHLLLLLAEGSRSVRELTELSGMSQTLVSHHLTPLREQGLVTVTPRGRSNVYALCCEALAGPVRLLATLAALTPEGADACCVD